MRQGESAMPKVIIGDLEFESKDEYIAALRAWEQHRAPFKAQADMLADEFVESLHQQGLSKRTINKHQMNIEMFIFYLTQYTDADDFATVR
jgi:hypothetical protein